MAKNINRKVTIYINGKEVSNTIQSLRSELIKLENQQKRATIGSEEYIRVTSQIKEIRNILRDETDNVNNLGKTWKSTVETAAEYSNIIMGVQSAFEMIDLGIGKLKDLAKDAAKLDDIYADVQKTTGLTHAEVEKLNEAFKKMDTRTSREELNKLAYEAGKLGLNSAEAVAQFVSASDKINIALGDVLGEGAMVAIGKLTNIFESSTKALEGKNLEEKMLAIGSAVNSLGQASTANEGYMVEFMKRLGGIAAQAGMSADQILGFASALDQNGQAVEMSATAFTKMIMQMVKKPEEFVKAAGVSFDEFKKMMDEDMNGAVLRVLEGMDNQGGFQQIVQMFNEMGLDGSRAAQSISTLAKHLDQVREAQALASKEIMTGSSVINEFNTKNETMQAKSEKAKKKFEEMRIKLGNELYPALISLQKAGTLALKGISGFVQLCKENKAILPGLILLMGNWVRVKILSYAADEKLQKSLRSLLGIEKLKAHRTDVQTAKTLKKVAAEEQERLTTLKNQLAIEKENLARQKSKVGMEAQAMVTVAETRVKQMEVAVTNQATVATDANTAAVNKQKAAFASTPWGLIITALTTIAGIVVGIVRNSEKWKLNQTLKEVAKQAGEAEGSVKVLFDRLQDATAGSEEYKKALEELKAAYPDLIAKHVDEEGKIKDLTAAYNDLTAAARQSVYDRMYSEKVGELQGELAEQLRKTLMGVSNWVDRYMSKMTEAERDAVRAQMNVIVREFSEGKYSMDEALDRMNKVMVKARGLHEGAITTYTGLLSGLNDKMKETERLTRRYKAELKANDADPFGVQKMSLKELEAELNKYLDMMDHGFSEGAERDAARLKAYRDQIAKLKKEQNNTTTTTTTGTGETEKERKEREKREEEQRKAEAAWNRFSQTYEQTMSKINAKTLTGIEAIIAEVDVATDKMHNELKGVDEVAHPEAAKMLKDLEEASEAWKRAKIDEYIAKNNKELDKLAKSAAKTGDSKKIDQVRKATAELEEKLHSIDDAILQLTFDQATLFSKTDAKSRKQLHRISERIESYKELRKAITSSVYAAIDTTVKNPFQKQEDNKVSLWVWENRAKALKKVDEAMEQYAKDLKDAIAAELAMAQAERENGTEEQAKAHEKKAEALKKQEENLKAVRKEAEEMAKDDALSKTLNKWAQIMEEFGNKALSVFSNINTILKNNSDQQLQVLQKQNEEEMKMLDSQLEQGLISQEQYEERKKAMEDDYKEKELQANREAFRREQAYSYAEAVINAAVAATKLWANEGTTAYKIAMSALLAAEMATQIEAIRSQPEPYAKGGFVKKKTYMMAGEAGPEWVASNKLLADPQTAPMIQALESYQRGNHRALLDIPMARLDVPAAMAASRQIGRGRTVEVPSRDWNEQGQPFTATDGNNREIERLLRELVKYEKDPRNRQVVMSRRTQTDFDRDEKFLREMSKLG